MKETFANHDEESNQKAAGRTAGSCHGVRHGDPGVAYNPGETEEDLNTKHEYAAFQIFTGDVKGNNIDDFKISNAKWGESITNPTEFLAQLTADPTIGGEFKTNFTAQDVLAVISKWHNSDDYSIAFARVVCHYLYPDANANPKTRHYRSHRWHQHSRVRLLSDR